VAKSVPLLSLVDLSVHFRTRGGVVEAIRAVSLQIARGELVGIVGESGSGKSVTAFTLMGLLDANAEIPAGSARFGGMELIGARESELRDLRGREISMIFQNPRAALNPIRRVGDQIKDVLREHTDTPWPKLRGKAIEALAEVRIHDPDRRYDAYPFELSGGMCQRVMIAMALACRPALLIADEPTTGLDVTTQKSIMDLIRDLAIERRMATILITHDLGLAAQYCHRIVVMQAGQVVDQAPTETLFRTPGHPYTRRLMAATPRLTSRLSDLLAASDEGDRLVAPAILQTAAGNKDDDTALLTVTDLVKSYPIGGATSWLSRTLFQRPEGTAPPPAFRAVDGISFDLAAGQSLAIVGESGCGKSTTSSMIARLLDPSAGRILFRGRDIGAVPAVRFAGDPDRRRIQMVFQDPTESLNPRWTAFACIADPIRRLGEVEDRRRLPERVRELAVLVGLDPGLLGRFPHQLSGGQKARVGISRAIALNPDLLVLDEPTSALDVSVQAVVLNLLDELRRRLGMTYIFVSHDLNVVRLLCDRVLVMRRGQIVEQGPIDRVLTSPDDPYTRALIDAVPHFEADGPAPTSNVAPVEMARAAD